MAGKRGRGGQNRIDPRLHLLRGTFRPERHQAALEASQPVWAPAARQLQALAADGQAFVERLRVQYELNPWEGELVLEAAVAVDRLAELRRTRGGESLRDRLALEKCEQLWQKQLSALLLSLRVRP
jgi:hypothetical protein